MPLGMELGLSPGDIVFDGDPAPPQHGDGAPNFRPMSCGQTAAWIKMPLGREVGLSPDDILLDGDPAPPPKKGSKPPPQFFAHFTVAKRLDASRCHLV